MSRRGVVITPCRRCGRTVVVLDTPRGKRIAVNMVPLGPTAYRYRDWNRNEEVYVYGEHQPHVVICPRREQRAGPTPIGRDRRRRVV